MVMTVRRSDRYYKSALQMMYRVITHKEEDVSGGESGRETSTRLLCNKLWVLLNWKQFKENSITDLFRLLVFNGSTKVGHYLFKQSKIVDHWSFGTLLVESHTTEESLRRHKSGKY
jgi:hypothetical protein